MTSFLARLLPKPGIGPALYCVWAIVAIGLSIGLSGLSPESVTRLLVIALLLGELALRPTLVGALPALTPKIRFLVLGIVLAAAVEGMHMISMPVFPALRIVGETSFVQGLVRYALDLLFTLPAYAVIFSLLWFFINRYRLATTPSSAPSFCTIWAQRKGAGCSQEWPHLPAISSW